MTIAKGDRVRIAIKDPSKWAHGAASCLDGKLGVVEEIQTHERMTGAPKVGGTQVLVRFDEPAEVWATHMTPWNAGWFGLDEFRSVQTAPRPK